MYIALCLFQGKTPSLTFLGSRVPLNQLHLSTFNFKMPRASSDPKQLLAVSYFVKTRHGPLIDRVFHGKWSIMAQSAKAVNGADNAR